MIRCLGTVWHKYILLKEWYNILLIIQGINQSYGLISIQEKSVLNTSGELILINKKKLCSRLFSRCLYYFVHPPCNLLRNLKVIWIFLDQIVHYCTWFSTSIIFAWQISRTSKVKVAPSMKMTGRNRYLRLEQRLAARTSINFHLREGRATSLSA